MNKSTKLSAKCRAYQRRLQAYADRHHGQHNPFVGLPMPKEDREWVGIVELPNRVAAEFRWLDDEPFDAIRVRLDFAMQDCLEFTP